MAVKKLTASTADDESETLCKKTVFEATQNKQRNDVSIAAELEAFMRKVDASERKIKKDLSERLKKRKKKKQMNANGDSLDLFMRGIEFEKNKKKFESERIYNDESKFDEGDLLISDDESFVLSEAKGTKKQIERIDHSKTEYPVLRKNVYVESPEICAMSWSDVGLIRSEMLSDCVVSVDGDCKEIDIKPILKWTQCGLSDDILRRLRKFGYSKPFAVQCQAIPAVMSGRDLICVASTGSGKTLAYILPLFRHCFYNRNAFGLPVCVVLVPTRELAQQIMSEVGKFQQVSSCALYGGVSIAEQIAKLKGGGADVIVATPGRLIECLSLKSVLDIRYVSYFVMDEADRLFDLGFESQICSILDAVRPDKQLVMFSATFPAKIERIARRYFLESQSQSKPMQITFCSSTNAPCPTVAQFVCIAESEEDKFKALLRLLSEWYGHGQILIFVATRSGVDALFSKLCDSGYFALTLHGGINQIDRDFTMIDFKNKSKTILICTSVASRGLDVEDLRVVINYFPPHHYEDYVHRIGRTGRAQRRGVAYTLINKSNLSEEAKCIPHCIRGMKAANCPISDELKALCQQYYSDVAAGKQAMHRNAGYDGKGFKYDASEMNAKKKQIERQAIVYGQSEELQEWNLNDRIKEIGQKEGQKEEEVVVLANLPKAEPALNRNLSALKKALLAAKKKKKKKGAKCSESDLKKTIDRTIQCEEQKHQKNTRERVESIAKIISQSFDEGEDGKGAAAKGKVYKLDINGYPANARKAVSYANNLVPIKENYNVQITQKGQFVASGRKAQKGESSLYLEIKGSNVSNIRGAIKELQQILNREAAKANHSMQSNRYSKFTVV